MNKSRRTVAQLVVVTLLGTAAACADEQADSPAIDQSNLNTPPAGGVLFSPPTGSDGNPLDETSPELDQRSFVLQSVEGDSTLRDAPVTLSFVRDELRFQGPCNGSNAKYGLEEGILRLGNIGSSLRGCPIALRAQDDWLRAFMAAGPGLVLSADQLTLRSADTALVFLDQAKEQAQLVGKTFSFLDLEDNGRYLVQSGTATVTFGADGALRFDTTCNTGSGTYSVSGDQLTLGALGSTGAVCTGDTALVESQLLGMLRSGTISFELEGDGRQLTLTSGDRQLQGSY